ncbi:MAG: S1 family peptidase [Chloroflexota bacterium]|jgi:hypothetical protein
MDPRKGVVAIKSSPQSDAILGAGFFVSSGVILTCAHVIEGYYHRDMTVYFQAADSHEVLGAGLEFYSPKEEFDVAVLKPRRAIDCACLRVVSSRESRLHEFSIFGYPALGDIHGLNGAGRILGWIQSPRGYAQLQLESRQVTQGFSGAPIWDLELESVVGMLQNGIKAEEAGRPSFGLPMEVLKGIYPDLPLETPVAKSDDGAAADQGGVTLNISGDVSGNIIIGSHNTAKRN